METVTLRPHGAVSGRGGFFGLLLLHLPLPWILSVILHLCAPSTIESLPVHWPFSCMSSGQSPPPLPLRMAHSPHSPANSIQPAHAISGRSFLSRASSSPSTPMAPHPHFGLEMASGIISCRFWQIGRQSLRCLGESHQDLLKASVSPCAPFPLGWTSAVFSLRPHHLLPQLPLPFPFFFPPLLWPECVSQS